MKHLLMSKADITAITTTPRCFSLSPPCLCRLCKSSDVNVPAFQ